MPEIYDDWNSDMDAFSDDFEEEQVTYEELLMEKLDEEEELIGLGLMGGW